jgi:hypothetical protein
MASRKQSLEIEVEAPTHEPKIALFPRADMRAHVAMLPGENPGEFDWFLQWLQQGQPAIVEFFCRTFTRRFGRNSGRPADLERVATANRWRERAADLRLEDPTPDAIIESIFLFAQITRRVDRVNSTMERAAYLPPEVNVTRILRMTAEVAGIGDALEPVPSERWFAAWILAGDAPDANELFQRRARGGLGSDDRNWGVRRRSVPVPMPDQHAPMWLRITRSVEAVERSHAALGARRAAEAERQPFEPDASGGDPVRSCDGVWRGRVNPGPAEAA